MDVAATSSVSAVRPGKAAQSLGHMAKAAVAEAKAAGADLPKNAQGMAASAIAQGADPASVFAAMVTSEVETPVEGGDPVEGEVPVAEGDDVAAPDAAVSDPAVEVASEGYAAAADVVAPEAASQDGAENALALLQDSSEAA